MHWPVNPHKFHGSSGLTGLMLLQLLWMLLCSRVPAASSSLRALNLLFLLPDQLLSEICLWFSLSLPLYASEHHTQSHQTIVFRNATLHFHPGTHTVDTHSASLQVFCFSSLPPQMSHVSLIYLLLSCFPPVKHKLL